MADSSIKVGIRNNTFDIRRKKAVEIGRYEDGNVTKRVLYRDSEGYFLEERNLYPAVDAGDTSVMGILTSKYFPMGRDTAYEWACEGHCDPSVLLAEFFEDDPEDVELIKKKDGEDENLITITGHKMAVIVTPTGESVFMYVSDRPGEFPVKIANSKICYFKKLFDNYVVTEVKAFDDLAETLSENQKKEQLFKVLLSKPEIEKISGKKYCINGYTVIAMDCFE